MINRNLSFPILCGSALLLLAHPPLLSPAQTSAPTPNSPGSLPSTTTTSADATAPAASHHSTYTVVAGDSLTSIAQKFGTTRKKLKKLNDLTSTTVHPGQVLQVPTAKSPQKTATALKSAKVHHTYALAQPVQDFDIPASTFGSCPVPLPSPDEDTGPAAPADSEKSAPIAKLVSPAEMAAEPPENLPPAEITPPTRDTADAFGFSIKHSTKPVSTFPANVISSPPVLPSPSLRLSSRGLGASPQPNPLMTTPSSDWGNRFLQEARALGDQGIEYDDDWRPPGESHAWTMDCSNTSRYLYKVTAGIQLPRTASDQYYYLHLQGKAWDVPQDANGFADGNFLRQNLKPGDLLFWENTYRPERQPPITHVMVFLGTNARGQWIMAGSQSSRGGEHNRRNGGPDIYVFRPSQPCGGYTTWLGLVRHQGRFCAFGRPLEADKAKLAVAADD
jgi:LysM repeat protein